jgi:cysteine desulfurase
MAIYLDCNATNPIEPRVREEIIRVFDAVYGNAGSPHEFGEKAKQLVSLAREQLTQIVGARRHEIVFTSGATESNNLAILGAAAHGKETGKMHLVSSMIEHKAVLEPLQALRKQGFEVTLIRPQSSGQIDPDELLDAVRDDTLLVSVMQVNNETGIIQPIDSIANGLMQRDCLFHVDAAQGFAKQLEPLRNPRIDLISVSGHKIHGPQGIGALIARRRQGQLPPLAPLTFGGGQEFGLRPGTLPVPLIAGLGLAAQLAATERNQRSDHCLMIRKTILAWAQAVDGRIHGGQEATMPHVVNLSIPGFTADELIEHFHGLLAVSDGAACTTICTTPSHVLSAMGIREPELSGAIRLSWSHLTNHKELEHNLLAAQIKLGR